MSEHISPQERAETIPLPETAAGLAKAEVAVWESLRRLRIAHASGLEQQILAAADDLVGNYDIAGKSRRDLERAYGTKYLGNRIEGLRRRNLTSRTLGAFSIADKISEKERQETEARLQRQRMVAEAAAAAWRKEVWEG